MLWISVKDKLPEVPKNKYAVSVLVAAIDIRYYVTHVLYDTKEGFTTFGYSKHDVIRLPVIDKITHWMYLPEPPDYEEGEACDI